MHVFLGITGASGAPYAARLLEALAAADCEIGVCASGAGIEVLATELFGDPTLPRDETLARLLAHRIGAARVYDPDDWGAPYASGTAKVDASGSATEAQQDAVAYRGYQARGWQPWSCSRIMGVG